jgi:hypothetical protein
MRQRWKVKVIPYLLSVEECLAQLATQPDVCGAVVLLELGNMDLAVVIFLLLSYCVNNINSCIFTAD